jgi:hypothetical protein
LSCRAFRDNAVRLQLFALAYNLANLLRSLALPNEAAQWSLTDQEHVELPAPGGLEHGAVLGAVVFGAARVVDVLARDGEAPALGSLAQLPQLGSGSCLPSTVDTRA